MAAVPYMTLTPAAGGATVRIRCGNSQPRGEQVTGAVVPSANGSPRSQVRVTGAVYETKMEKYRPAELSAIRAAFPSGSRVLASGRRFSPDRASLPPAPVAGVLTWGEMRDEREGYTLYTYASFTLTTATPPV